jgi:hypothetical protein
VKKKEKEIALEFLRSTLEFQVAHGVTSIPLAGKRFEHFPGSKSQLYSLARIHASMLGYKYVGSKKKKFPHNGSGPSMTYLGGIQSCKPVCCHVCEELFSTNTHCHVCSKPTCDCCLASTTDGDDVCVDCEMDG